MIALQVGREVLNPAELEFNLAMVENARFLLCKLLDLHEPSGLLPFEVFRPVKLLFEAFGVNIMLYPPTDGSEKGSVGVSLDLGSLAMSGVTGGAPGGIPPFYIKILRPAPPPRARGNRRIG